MHFRRTLVTFTMRTCLRTLTSQLINPGFCSRSAGIHGPVFKRLVLDNPAIQFCLNEARELKYSKDSFNSHTRNNDEEILHEDEIEVPSGIQISHPWPQWVDLMKKLMKKGYFDQIGNNPFEKNGVLSNKEANSIRSGCLNFARDHYQLISYLSKKDILVITKTGCPCTDRKVVNSGKRLRAHVGIEEGNVCSSCMLRGDCDRAYVKAREEEGGRTVDVMRLLLTYALDPIVGAVQNKPCLNERVQESVRSLLKEMVDIRIEDHGPEPARTMPPESTASSGESEGRVFSKANVPMKQGDWNCPECNFHNFARNYKCLRCGNVFHERLKKLVEEHGRLPLKKGDWICDNCNLLNFARNTSCYLCKGKPPKRELILGEWECVSCNYINFRRNMLCLKCDHPRSIASKRSDIPSQSLNKNHSPRQRQSMYERDGSMKFVENEAEEQFSSRSSSGFMNFPVAGGKSDLSQDLKEQELWRKQMARVTEDDDYRSRCNYPMFLDDDGDGDDDDDMVKWFEGGRNG